MDLLSQHYYRDKGPKLLSYLKTILSGELFQH